MSDCSVCRVALGKLLWCGAIGKSRKRHHDHTNTHSTATAAEAPSASSRPHPGATVHPAIDAIEGAAGSAQTTTAADSEFPQSSQIPSSTIAEYSSPGRGAEDVGTFGQGQRGGGPEYEEPEVIYPHQQSTGQWHEGGQEDENLETVYPPPTQYRISEYDV